MDVKKNLSMFREYIKTKYKYAQIFSNQISKFAERDYRTSVFKIKSDLAHDLEKDEVLYIPVNLWRAITRAYTDFVIGMWYNVDFWSDELNEKFVEIDDWIKLQKILNEAIDIQSSIWYCVIRCRKRENDDFPRVEIIPVSNYCANMEWLSIWDSFEDIKEHYVFSVVDEWTGGKKYFYVDRYEKNENWKWWTGHYWEKWKYTANYVLSEKYEEWTEEPLEKLPLFLFNNDLTNIHVVEQTDSNKTRRDYYGDIPRFFNQSDYVDLADLFQEINDRWSQISVEFIKNLTSKLSVPAWFASAQTAKNLRNKAKWEDDFSENPDYLVHNPGETPAQYITKDATYITVTLEQYFPHLLKLVAIISGVPASMLGASLYGGWNNPVWTTEKEYSTFYSRIEKKQLEIYSPLQKLFRMLVSLDWKEIAELPTIKFKKPTAYDIAERTNTAVTQMNAWIMSKKSAMMYTMGYDDSEAEEQLKEIQQEERDSYAKYQAAFEKKEDMNEKVDKKEDEEKDQN